VILPQAESVINYIGYILWSLHFKTQSCNYIFSSMTDVSKGRAICKPFALLACI
jgi:hypothetical protein